MTINRYQKRDKITNIDKLYREHFKRREINYINQYSKPKFDYNLEQINFETVEHVWAFGDRLSKLAELFYSDPTLWWIIAFVNQKPTEHHFKEGDIILIPTSAKEVLEFMGI